MWLLTFLVCFGRFSGAVGDTETRMDPRMQTASTPPHVVLMMIDDLGRYDTEVTNPNAKTPSIAALVNEGIRLDRHYVYMYCSPTRRSFLSGRFPTSINPNQASICSNFLPLQFTLITEKLQTVGYESHFVGKGHLGYPTTQHLPVNRGYVSHVGYLGGAEQYDLQTGCRDFWNGTRPAPDLAHEVYYSTNYYTEVACNKISLHNASRPLFLDLRYQGVHGPYVNPPVWEQVANTSECASQTHFYLWDHTANTQNCGSTYTCQIMESMVSVVDSGIGNVTALLKSRLLWNNTLIIFTADNGGGMGGSEPSNNYPLRGTKGQPWEGGVRAAAFVSGGLVPARLHGTTNSAFMHVADWYPTIANLAGVDPTNTVVYNGTARPIDGIDVWPVLMGTKSSLEREFLPTTNQSLIWNSRYKLITSAPSTHWFTETDGHIEDGWLCRGRAPRNISTKGVWQCMVCTDAEPCLFDVLADPEERVDIALQHPDIVSTIQSAMYGLNFPPYTGETLLPEESQHYHCLQPHNASLVWWGGFQGPCCKPKSL